jgi:hypothetical protein
LGIRFDNAIQSENGSLGAVGVGQSVGRITADRINQGITTGIGAAQR